MKDVQLATCQLDDDTDIACAQAAKWLSEDETTRAARFRFERDQNRYIRARGFLRRTLAQELGTAPDTLRFDYSNTNKPALRDGSVQFNLSHSGDQAALAFGHTGPLGIDIELLDRSNLFRDLEGLTARCFNHAEAQVISDAPDQQERFLVFWTAKEARMKLTGEGLGLDPKSISLALDADGMPTGYLVPQSPETWFEHFALPGLVGAITGAKG